METEAANFSARRQLWILMSYVVIPCQERVDVFVIATATVNA